MKRNKKPVIAYLFSHWDAEWYKTVSSFNVRLNEIFDNVLLELKKENAPSFYFDGQIYALLNYLKFNPNKKNLIKKLIKEKKLFIGPFFVSADSFLVSGASILKNLELGLKISKEFNENEFIGYLSDTFGHSNSIFKILNYFNIKNAIIWRGAPDIEADFIANNINITRLVRGYYQDILHSDLNITKKAEILEKELDKINEKSGNILLLPLGADHMNILENANEKIEKINKLLKNYEIILSNPFEYFKRAEFKKNLGENVEFLDNSNTYILPGVYSTRSDEKIQNAILEYELFYKADIFNFFMGGKYDRELNYATVELIKNHAHDSIYGCSVDEVHKMVKCRQIKVGETVNTVIKNLIRDFKKENLIKENENKIGVFNFSNFEYGGVAKLISDKKIKNAQKIREFNFVSDDIFYNINQNPITEDFHKFFEYIVEIEPTKPFSFKNFEIKKPTKLQIVGNDFIENEFFKLFILDNKIYVIDKKTGEIYPDFIQLHSTKDNGDSYNYAPAGYPKILKLKNSKAKVNGKIKSTLQLTFEENIKLNCSLSNNSKLFELDFEFINKKKNRKLQIVFNTNKPLEKTYAGDAVGGINRLHNPNYLLFENIPVQDRSELKTNSFPMQKFVQGNNLSIFTKGLYEYEIYKNSLKIALLRSIGIISNPKNPARKIPAGPPIELFDAQGLYEHKISLAFAFGIEKKDLEKSSKLLFEPILAISGEFKNKNKTFIKKVDDGAFLGISDMNGKKKPVFIK